MNKKENKLSETGWFPHDTDCITDLKIAALLQDFGPAGYGIFWHILELLHAEKTGTLPLGSLVEKAIAGNMKVDVMLVQSIMNNCLNEYTLLTKNGDSFTSDRVQRNIAARQESYETRRAAGSKGGKAKAANAKQNHSNATAEPKPGSSDALAKGSTVQDSTVHKPLKGFIVLDDVKVPNDTGDAIGHDPLEGSALPLPVEAIEKVEHILGMISDRCSAERLDEIRKRIERLGDPDLILALKTRLRGEFKFGINPRAMKAADLERALSEFELNF